MNLRVSKRVGVFDPLNNDSDGYRWLENQEELEVTAMRLHPFNHSVEGHELTADLHFDGLYRFFVLNRGDQEIGIGLVSVKAGYIGTVNEQDFDRGSCDIYFGERKLGKYPCRINLRFEKI